MSALIVSNDLQMVLLEVVVRKLYVPWDDILDKALLKKTVIMFRMLDEDWISVSPNRRDYRSYRGSNSEVEYFYGGNSVLFCVPESMFQEDVQGVDVQFHVYKEISEYFERESRQNVGFVLVRVDDLFNSIIKDLKERQELAECMTKTLERQPISRSSCGVYRLLDEELLPGNSTVELYIRITHLGKCVITEINSPECIRKAFYTREEADPRFPYQMRELKQEEVENGSWGSTTIMPPKFEEVQPLTCYCEEAKVEAEIAEAERIEIEEAKAEAVRLEAEELAKAEAEAEAAASEAAAVAAAEAQAKKEEAAKVELAKAEAAKAEAADTLTASIEKSQTAADDIEILSELDEDQMESVLDEETEEEEEPRKLTSEELFEINQQRILELIEELRKSREGRGGGGTIGIAVHRGRTDGYATTSDCAQQCMPVNPCYNPCLFPWYM